MFMVRVSLKQRLIKYVHPNYIMNRERQSFSKILDSHRCEKTNLVKYVVFCARIIYKTPLCIFQLDRICAHNAQLESRLSRFGLIMFAQCCMLLILTFVIVSNYWNSDLHGHPRPRSSCKPWSLEE